MSDQRVVLITGTSSGVGTWEGPISFRKPGHIWIVIRRSPLRGDLAAFIPEAHEAHAHTRGLRFCNSMCAADRFDLSPGMVRCSVSLQS